MTLDASIAVDTSGCGILDVGSIFDEASQPPLPMNEWVRKNRRIIGGARPGKWDPRNAPFAEEPMISFSTRGVNAVSVMTPTQLMKSEFAVNCAVYSAYHGMDVLFYEPDFSFVKGFFQQRIRPALIQAGVPLGADKQQEGIKRKDSMMELRLPGGGSIKGLTPGMRMGKAGHDARVVILDELDAMHDSSMLQVAKSRITSYVNEGRIVCVSVPGLDVAGSIYRRWFEGSRGEWMGRCIHCNDLALLRWGNVKIQKDASGLWLPETATMHCSSCKAAWTEADRMAAITAGEYRHHDPDNPHRSFWVPGMAHIWRTVYDIAETGAAAWQAGLEEHDWGIYELFIKEYAGEVWDQSAQGLSSRRLRKDTYDLGIKDADTLGTLDPRVMLITMGADVGGESIHAEVMGWGIDEETGRVLCFGLRHFVVEGFDRVDGSENPWTVESRSLWDRFSLELERSVWRHPSLGRVVGIHRGCIDCGWKTEIVRSWAQEKYREEMGMGKKKGRAHPFGATILPVMSKSVAGVSGLRIDFKAGWNGKSRYLGKYNPAYVSICSQLLKEDLYDSMKIDKNLPEAGKQANVWPSDLIGNGYPDSYFDELTSEYPHTTINSKGRHITEWVVKKGSSGRNEAWDCRVYGYAAAHIQAARFPTLAAYLTDTAESVKAALEKKSGGAEVVPIRG